MSVSSAAMSRQDRYMALRRKLTDCSYTETFGIEACDLVEKLFADVTTTSQSCRQLQEKESRLMNDLALAQAQLFPLRKENARLARENHELHLDHIKKSEESRAEMDRYAQKTRELGDQITELRLMNKLVEEQMREKDDTIEKLREAYEEISDPALKSKHNMGAQIKTTARVTHDSVLSGGQANATLLSMWRSVQQKGGDQQGQLLTSLQGQLQAMKDKLLDREHESAQLKSALAAREQELSRTSKLIGNAAAGKGDSASSALAGTQFGLDHSATEASNKRIIDQLNGQVDFLNTELAFREAQLSSFSQQLGQFESMKAELGIKSTSLDKVKEENMRLTQRVQFLENKVIALRSVAQTASHTPRPMSSTHSHAHAHGHSSAHGHGGSFFSSGPLTPVSEAKDPRESRDDSSVVLVDSERHLMTDRMRDENQHLQREIQGLQEQVTELQDQLLLAQSTAAAAANVRHSTGGVRRAGVTASPKTVASSAVVSVRRGTASAASSTTSSPAHHQPSSHVMVELNREVEDLRKKNATLTKQLREKDAQLSYLQQQQQPQRAGAAAGGSSTAAAAVEEAARQRQELQEQLEVAQRDLLRAETARQRAESMVDVAQRDLQTAQQGHRELRQELSQREAEIDRLERQALEVQGRERQFERDRARWTREKDALEALINEQQRGGGSGREEVRELEVARPPPPPPTLPSATTGATATSAVVSALQEELSAAQHELLAVRRAQKDAQQELVLWQSRYQELVAQHEGMLASSQRDSAMHTVQQQQAQQTSMTTQKLTEALVKAQVENGQLSSKVTLLERDCVDKDRVMQQLHAQHTTLQQDAARLQQRTQELQQLIKRLEAGNIQEREKGRGFQELTQRLQQQLMQQEDLLREAQQQQQVDRQERETLHETLYSMERERDALTLERENKEEQRRQVFQDLETLAHEHKAVRKQLQQTDKDYQHLQKDYAKLQALCTEVSQRETGYHQEIDTLKRRLAQKVVSEGHAAEDLVLMTKENQALSRDLATVLSERDGLLAQLRERHAQLQSVEARVRAQEIELDDLKENYKSLAQERRRMEEDYTAVLQRSQQETSVFTGLQREKDEVQQGLSKYQQQEQLWLQERTSLLQQLEVASDRLVHLQREKEAIDRDSQRTRQDVASHHQQLSLLQDRNSVILKRASAASEANKVLTTRLSTVERERDALRALIEVERQRSLDMTKVAEIARVEAATKDIQLERLRRDLEEAQQQQRG